MTASSRSKPAVRPALVEDAVPRDRIDDAILAFHAAYQAVIAEADDLLAQQGLARSHHKVLYHAARHPRCSVTEVREFIGVTRQAMQRPLGDLHRLGLIEIVASPSNRRVHQLVLTDSGARLENDVTGLMRQRFEAAFSRVGQVSVKHWLAVMAALAG